MLLLSDYERRVNLFIENNYQLQLGSWQNEISVIKELGHTPVLYFFFCQQPVLSAYLDWTDDLLIQYTIPDNIDKMTVGEITRTLLKLVRERYLDDKRKELELNREQLERAKRG